MIQVVNRWRRLSLKFACKGIVVSAFYLAVGDATRREVISKKGAGVLAAVLRSFPGNVVSWKSRHDLWNRVAAKWRKLSVPFSSGGRGRSDYSEHSERESLHQREAVNCCGNVFSLFFFPSLKFKWSIPGDPKGIHTFDRSENRIIFMIFFI